MIKQEIEIVQEETCEDVTEEKCVNFEVSFFPHIFHLFSSVTFSLVFLCHLILSISWQSFIGIIMWCCKQDCQAVLLVIVISASLQSLLYLSHPSLIHILIMFILIDMNMMITILFLTSGGGGDWYDDHHVD